MQLEVLYLNNPSFKIYELVASGISTATSYILPIAAIDCDYDSVIGMPIISIPTITHYDTHIWIGPSLLLLLHQPPPTQQQKSNVVTESNSPD
jgi:hypothetical protein